MKKILFEDASNTPSSVLLNSSVYGENIYFSEGCSKILDKCISIMNPDDTIYILYDVSPNNTNTRTGYNKLKEAIRENGLKNVYVIPIICIEYYICQMFYKFHYFNYSKNLSDLIDNLVKTFNYNEVLDRISKDKNLSESLEHIYKHIIENQGMICIHNKFRYDSNGKTRIKNDPRGIFYVKDCNCDRRYCKINSTDSLELKANRLYTELPIYIVDSNDKQTILKEMQIEIYPTTIDEVLQKQQDFYDNICEEMGINSIKV